MTANPDTQCKLIREAVSGYVSEETDTQKLSYLRDALVALVGTEEQRTSFLFGRHSAEDDRTADPRFSTTDHAPEEAQHTPDASMEVSNEDDLPAAVMDYLDPSPAEPVVSEESLGVQESPAPEQNTPSDTSYDAPTEQQVPEEAPVPRVSPLAPHESAEDTPAEAGPAPEPEVTAAKQDATAKPPKEENPEEPKKDQERDKHAPPKQSFMHKHTPFQELIDEGKYKTPYRGLVPIKKALRTFGFGDEQFGVIDAAVAYRQDDPKHIYTLFIDRAFTLPFTYGDIKAALEHAKVQVPPVKYPGCRTFEEKYKQRACWYVWSRMRDAMDNLKKGKQS